MIACAPNGDESRMQTLPGKLDVDPTPPPVDDPARFAEVTEPTFVAQEGWVAMQPSSSMRRVQYALPKVEGDAEDGELVVYQFAGQGGGVEANFERWSSQFEQVDGKPSRERATTTIRRVGPFVVHELALTGRYVAETSPGSGVRVDKPNFALFAAVIEGPGGPFYAKATGPVATLSRWRPSWDAFVGALAPAR